MSYLLVAKVLDEVVLPPPEKAVLVAMAEMCRDRDEPFYLSQRQLMYRTGHAERTIRQAIVNLRGRGLIDLLELGSRTHHSASVYRLDLETFPAWGPPWEWSLTRAQLRGAQAAAVIAVAVPHSAPPEARAAVEVRQQPPQPQARATAGSSGRCLPPNPYPVQPGATPALAPETSSGASRLSLRDLAKETLKNFDEEDLESERSRQLTALSARRSEKRSDPMSRDEGAATP